MLVTAIGYFLRIYMTQYVSDAAEELMVAVKALKLARGCDGVHSVADSEQKHPTLLSD